MYCNYCGKVIQDDANVCAYCGIRVGAVTARKRLVRPRVDRKIRRVRRIRRVFRLGCYPGALGLAVRCRDDRRRPAGVSNCVDSHAERAAEAASSSGGAASDQSLIIPKG